MTDVDPPIAAATLIVMRPNPVGAPDILVVKRAASMAFAGGAIVFPGGRIDAADIALAQRLGVPESAAKISALRETAEESAVLAGVLSPVGSIEPRLGPVIQQELLAGHSFMEVLERHELMLDLSALAPFSRWMPAFKQARRFDTQFFLTAALPGAWIPRPQPGECDAACWTSAAEALERVAAGEDHAIFPTKRNLERLAQFGSIEEARGDAEKYSLETIVPWVEARDGIPQVCIPEGRGYPITSEPLTSAVRA